uniref:Riboflavin transporter MCH5 n=1 Tax=Talaromyces marneffei PM1 TaxID=1077442 RepID=A0A093VBJ2_TALMA
MHRSALRDITEILTLEPTSPEEATEGVSLAFPEGGREGWTCLLGSCLLMFPSFGFQSAVGSVQDYISMHQLVEYSIRDVGWISAILVFLTQFLGVQFHRRRALPSGLCMAGSSAGGAVIPLILQVLFERGDWKPAIRTVALVALGCYTLGVIMVRGRLPGHTSKAMVDFRAFRSLRLCFLTVAVFSFEFIIFGCAALLPTYVRFAGMSSTVQFYSLTVLNSMSFMGRVLPGFVADQFGRFNVLLCLVVVTLVVMAGVWLPWGSRNDATLYAVVAIFGFSSGGWLSLAPVCAGQLCRTEDYGRYYGTIYFVAAFGVLLTVPVGSDLLQSTSPQVLIGFYSAVLLVGFIALALSRWALLDWRWK